LFFPLFLGLFILLFNVRFLNLFNVLLGGTGKSSARVTPFQLERAGKRPVAGSGSLGGHGSFTPAFAFSASRGKRARLVEDEMAVHQHSRQLRRGLSRTGEASQFTSIHRGAHRACRSRCGRLRRTSNIPLRTKSVGLTEGDLGLAFWSVAISLIEGRQQLAMKHRAQGHGGRADCLYSMNRW